MTKQIKGGPRNGKKHEPSTGILPATERNLLSDFPTFDMAVDFGEIHAEALHSVIKRVCLAGGYIGFSAPAGGASVKLRCSIGDASLERWVRDGHQLASVIVALHKHLEARESSDTGGGQPNA